uniref:Uncharacterized protein n=2 Tax=Panagrolaimus sp. JU765 TaxID=591449 RepID=A0AC34QA28_9BILA
MTDESSDAESLQDRIKCINLACDKLLNCLHSETAESEEKWKSLEKMYEKHVSELAESCLEFRTENAKLKHKLAENNTKINAVLNENEFLRWENGQFGLEVESLRNQLDESNLLAKELEAEVKCLQLNQAQINHLHSRRLKDELTSVRDVQTTREEHLKRKIEDLERQNGLAEMQLRSKTECLEEEMMAKNEAMKTLEQKLKMLIKENKKLNQQFNMFKKEAETEMEMLYSRETELEAELTVALETAEVIYSRKEVEDKVNVLLNEKSVKIEKCLSEIATLKTEIESLRESQGLDSDAALQKLNDKVLEIGKFRERTIFLEEELRLEKEQRQNATILLAQMGKDMKVLLKAAKQM